MEPVCLGIFGVSLDLWNLAKLRKVGNLEGAKLQAQRIGSELYCGRLGGSPIQTLGVFKSKANCPRCESFDHCGEISAFDEHRTLKTKNNGNNMK